MAKAIVPKDWLTEDERIIQEAYKRFKACEEWEATAWTNFEYDYKFGNGDSINNYQWDSWVIGDREDTQRPCLTINKTAQHCFQIINDGKQNKPGVNIRPVGEDASYEAAQIFQEIIRHIEYVSNAEGAYDKASEFQVMGGIGFWRLMVDYVTEKSFDQDITIKPINNPRSVRLDCNIKETDGSDANYGFIFDDVPKDLYDADYPDFTDVGGSNVLDSSADGWFTKNHVRVAEYFRKSNKPDRYIWFVLPETQEEIEGYYSELKKEHPDTITIFEEIKKRENNLPTRARTYREKDVRRAEVEWYKIAGDKIIDRKPWLGKYIPIIRIIGRETVIDGQLDRSGHVRPLLDPQRIYNINSSANVEFGALQTKSPLLASGDAIEGYEENYKSANLVNAAWLAYNAYDEEGRKLDPPTRLAAPVASPAYVQQLQIAQNEMMMVSGQYQAQMGEQENAKSGIAINQRQRQGDRATYHFIDGQSVGIRFTGKQLIDLIPKVYDTKRIMRIEAKDGTILNLTIDPNHTEGFTKNVIPKGGMEQAQQQAQQQQQIGPDGQPIDPMEQMLAQEHEIEIIFNPNVGNYAVQSDTGPSFATKRQEAFNALTQIAAQNKEFMSIGGDLLWKVADFPEAQELAKRWRKIIPPNITGDAPNPQLTAAMQQAAAKIEQQLGIIAKQTKELADKNRELDLKEREIQLREREHIHSAEVVTPLKEIRADYDAMSKRITALGNSGPAISVEQVQPLIKQLINEALMQAGRLNIEDEVNALPGPHEGGTVISNLGDQKQEVASDAPAG
jgi:hypothetical protein